MSMEDPIEDPRNAPMDVQPSTEDSAYQEMGKFKIKVKYVSVHNGELEAIEDELANLTANRIIEVYRHYVEGTTTIEEQK